MEFIREIWVGNDDLEMISLQIVIKVKLVVKNNQREFVDWNEKMVNCRFFRNNA